MMMGADFHAAQAREVTFSLIGANTLVHVAERMIDPARVVRGVKGIPSRAFVGMNNGASLDYRADEGDALRFCATNESQGPTAALAGDDNDLALAGLVFQQAAVLAVGLLIGGLAVATEIGTIDLDNAANGRAHILARHGFAQLVRENEGCLVLAIQIARQLKGSDALGTVHEDDDRGQQVGEGHFAACEDRAAGDAELVVATNALELAARGDVACLDTATARANGFPIVVRPAHLAERRISLVFAHGKNSLEADRAGLAGEEKGLHVIVSGDVVHWI